MARDDWSILFYVDANGNRPVREFLSSLDQQTQARFDWSIEQLRIRNLSAREPLVKYLEGKIWELRRESQTNIFRLLYAFVSGRRILFCMVFRRRPKRRHEVRLSLPKGGWMIFYNRKEVTKYGQRTKAQSVC